jgi:TolA-binding protein
MTKNSFPLATMVLVFHFSLANAAAPDLMQPSRPTKPPGSNVPQLQLTPDFLYQQITALQQQVASLQGQVNLLRSVVQITQNGTTIQAGNMMIKGTNGLTVTSGKDLHIASGADMNIESAKDLSLKSGKNMTSEGAGQIKLKAPQIKLNDGTKPIALKDSPVAGGKVISGSTTIFAK